MTIKFSTETTEARKNRMISWSTSLYTVKNSFEHKGIQKKRAFFFFVKRPVLK